MEVAAAYSVVCALRDVGVQGMTLKWLNDVWTRGHKIAGILVENRGKLEGNLIANAG